MFGLRDWNFGRRNWPDNPGCLVYIAVPIILALGSAVAYAMNH